VVTGRLRCNRW